MDEIAQMEAIRHLKDSEGWALVEQYLNSRIADHKAQLMTCPIEEVPKHREKVKAYESVFLYVQEVIDVGTEALILQNP